jgi:hypothetical protein
MKAAICDVEMELEKVDKQLVNKATTQMTPGFLTRDGSKP